MSRSPLGWTAALWLVLCAGLTAVVAYQLTTSFPLAPTVTAAPPGTPLLEDAEPPEEPRAPSDDAVDEIAARPLFSADRRPYVAPPVTVEEAPVVIESSLPIELAGTLLTPDRRAALLLVTGRTPAWLRSGETIEGWEIGSIEQDHVVLRKGGQEREVHLRQDQAGPQSSLGTPRRTTRRQNADSQGNDADSSPDDQSLRGMARSVLGDDGEDLSEEDQEQD